MSQSEFFSLRNKETLTNALYQVCLKKYGVQLDETFMPLFNQIMEQVWNQNSTRGLNIKSLDQATLAECQRHVEARLAQEQPNAPGQTPQFELPQDNPKTNLEELFEARKQELLGTASRATTGSGTVPLNSIIGDDKMKTLATDTDHFEEYLNDKSSISSSKNPSPIPLEPTSKASKELRNEITPRLFEGGMVLLDLSKNMMDVSGDHVYRVQFPSFHGKMLESVSMTLPKIFGLQEQSTLYLEISEMSDRCHLTDRKVSGVFYLDKTTEHSLIYKPHFCGGMLTRDPRSLGLQILDMEGNPIKIDGLNITNVEKSRSQQALIFYNSVPHDLRPGDRVRVSYYLKNGSRTVKICRVQISQNYPTMFVIKDPMVFNEGTNKISVERMINSAQFLFKVYS